ncbi:hypothetical protein MA9V2_071 [Chryseobacterium phage MA9V-2]|nr:hypothetical protein MA9V2_071 [Chryseobacterium phage MA9V-2]
MAFDDLQFLGNDAHVNYDGVGDNIASNYSEGDNQMQAELPRSAVAGFKTAKKSIFNNFYAYSGDPLNIFMDQDTTESNLYKNPTLDNLLFKTRGANRFDETDFAYCTKYGQIPNNRLVTLRRFKFPVYDDIFGVKYEPDIARMVTWSTQDENQFTDLFKWSYGMNWKELTAEMEAMQQSSPGIGYDGVIGKILDNYVSPNTNPQDYYDPKHDQNKAYGPVDSINKTHIRDVGLNFDKEVELVFHYETKSYGGVNAKAAMLDLISHILVCTSNEGKFWGGSRYWAGRPPSEYANRIRHWSNETFSEFVQSSNVNVKSLLGSLASSISQNLTAENVIDMATKVLKNMAISKALDFAGRASVPLMNSLLTSDPVGEWHITIGNPFRPQLVMGNMILTETTIEAASNALQYDDFPTGIKVTCKLKPAMPRGRAEMEQMLAFGNARTYWKPSPDDFDKITRTGKYVKESMRGHTAADIAITGRELYSFAQTELFSYDNSLKPKPAANADAGTGQTTTPNTTNGGTISGGQ